MLVVADDMTGANATGALFAGRGMRTVSVAEPAHLARFAGDFDSLREALDNLTRQSLTRAIEESWTALEVLGHDPPRLAVAALNPHGGEGGNFGEEEIKIIGPACEQARRSGRAVDGPIPADSVFHQGLQGRYDGILAQFHDQGHIAAKTVDFDGTVSVTMGMPILRTSVDHGTAFDIAGTGKASHAAMAAAYRVAAELAAYADRVRAEYGTKR